jgi:uncharacterized repeat protein (TIGR01451 family)
MRTHRLKAHGVIYWIVLSSLLLALLAPRSAAAKLDVDHAYRIVLKSRQFVPARGVEPALARELETGAVGERRHVLLQLIDIPTAAQRAALQEAGIYLLDYVPYYTWFASIPTSIRATDLDLALIRWMGRIAPADRLAPALRQAAFEPATPIGLEVLFLGDVQTAEALFVLAAHGATLDGQVGFDRYAVRLDPSALVALAAEDDVLWIAPASPPKVRDNDGIRARTGVDTVHGAPYGLSGSGVDLGIWDGGLVDSHVDFTGRLRIEDPFSGVDNHATHVAGTMAGDGRNSASQGGTAFQWKGMAPGADIISYDWDDPINEHDRAINVRGIELSQNSWGYGVSDLYGNCWLYGDYDALAPDYDAIITGRYGRRISVIFSAGNERNDGDCGMSSVPPYLNYGNIGPPHTAKNAIIVGATNSNNDSMTTFSSWGPVDDGRLKPDVVAPGCESAGEGYIHSTLPGDVYGAPGWCGTSMSAPAVSGISALLIEQYRNTVGRDPLPSTIRALLIQTAVDMNSGSTVYYNPGPDYASGYGRVDARAAADAIRARQVNEDQVSNGQSDVYTLTVPAGTPSLKVTLAWDDVPGTPNAVPALVNNLDLVLVAPDGSTNHRPWVLNPTNPTANATRGVDSINNVEQVLVNNPAAGTWEVRVSGTQVPQGPQLYSLVSSIWGDDGTGNVGPLTYEGHAINDEGGNGDGKANPGETIQLTITLRNGGSETANDVQATISTSDSYVTLILSDTATYGDVAAGGTATHTAPLSFRISPAAPDQHVIQFDLDISASNGGPWSDTLDQTVYWDDQMARVSIDKAVEPTTISAGDLLTYTVQRSLWLTGTHTYSETLVDPIPAGTTYVANSATLNGTPFSGAYSPTLDSLYLQQSGTFAGSHALVLTFQVQAGSVGSAVVNTVTGTASVDGIALGAPYTATVSATTCDLPAAPALFVPPDGTVTCDLVPTFGWSWVSGSDGYRIQVDDDPAFGSPVLDQTAVGTFYTYPGSLPAGTYYWRVRAVDACGEGPWSETWSMTVLSTSAAPVLASPGNGSKTGDRTPTFAWEAADGADMYLVQVDTDPDFDSPIEQRVETTSYTPVAALEFGTYYWRVQASGPCGTGSWSLIWTVTITPMESIYLPIVVYNTS